MIIEAYTLATSIFSNSKTYNIYNVSIKTYKYNKTWNLKNKLTNIDIWSRPITVTTYYVDWVAALLIYFNPLIQCYGYQWFIIEHHPKNIRILSGFNQPDGWSSLVRKYFSPLCFLNTAASDSTPTLNSDLMDSKIL